MTLSLLEKEILTFFSLLGILGHLSGDNVMVEPKHGFGFSLLPGLMKD